MGLESLVNIFPSLHSSFKGSMLAFSKCNDYNSTFNAHIILNHLFKYFMIYAGGILGIFMKIISTYSY